MNVAPARVTTERRSHDFIAFLEDDRAKWEAGKTEQEAVEKLVVSHDLQAWTVNADPEVPADDLGLVDHDYVCIDGRIYELPADVRQRILEDNEARVRYPHVG